VNDLFSTDGLAAWRLRLESSAEFQTAADDWTGSLLLREVDGSPPARAVWVALDHGRLSACRVATPADIEDAEFVLAASPAAWRQLVSAQVDLAQAALSGVLRLERGSVFRLLPHVRAATALLRAANAP
jgi:putative sterol carrier protein